MARRRCSALMGLVVSVCAPTYAASGQIGSWVLRTGKRLGAQACRRSVRRCLLPASGSRPRSRPYGCRDRVSPPLRSGCGGGRDQPDDLTALSSGDTSVAVRPACRRRRRAPRSPCPRCRRRPAPSAARASRRRRPGARRASRGGRRLPPGPQSRTVLPVSGADGELPRPAGRAAGPPRRGTRPRSRRGPGSQPAGAEVNGLEVARVLRVAVARRRWLSQRTGPQEAT